MIKLTSRFFSFFKLLILFSQVIFTVSDLAHHLDCQNMGQESGFMEICSVLLEHLAIIYLGISFLFLRSVA